MFFIIYLHVNQSVDSILITPVNVQIRNDTWEWPFTLITPLCHYFSSDIVRLFAYVFTGGDPQLEWLKRNESNRIYWFQTGILSLVYL